MANKKEELDITEMKTKVYEAAACDGLDGDIVSFIKCIDDESVISDILNHHTEEGGQNITPLIVASKKGNTNAVRSLLNLSHNLDLEQTGTVKFLIETCRGVTALWCAVAALQFDIVQLLVENGADLNHSSINNSSPLRVACLRGNLKIVQYLLNHGADVKIAYKNENTCLMAACIKGNIQIVKLLIGKGADLDFEGDHGTTALHLAAQCGHVDIVNLLITFGAAIKKNEFSVTPLMIAAAHGKVNVVSYLTALGQSTGQEKSDALALLGASFTDEGNHCLAQAYNYMKDALEIRLSLQNSSGGIKYKMAHAYNYMKETLEVRQMSNTGRTNDKLSIIHNSIFDSRTECKTLLELENIKDNYDALHIESLLIRERLLGNDPIMSTALIRKGDYFHACGVFDKCVNLWLHALKLNQNLDRPSYHASRFVEVFKDIGIFAVQIDLETLLEVLKYASREVELNQKWLSSGEVSPTIDTIAEMYGDNILVCICIIIRSLGVSQTADDMQRVRKAVYDFIKLQPVLANGYTPLHISCQVRTPLIFKNCTFVPVSHPLLCQTLLACGATVNAQDKKKNTPLHVVAESMTTVDNTDKLKETFMCLIENGAHFDMCNAEGEMPLEVAASDDAKTLIRRYDNTNLMCLASRVIRRHRVPYKKYMPQSLQEYIELH